MTPRCSYSQNQIDAVLYLVRVALDHWDGALWEPIRQFSIDDWKQTKRFATDQQVPAIALDGLSVLIAQYPDIHVGVSQEDWELFYIKWVGQQMVVEQQYEQYVATLSHLARFYHQHGIRMMVLKGYGLSLNYPKPNHRLVGDLDIYLFGKQVEADCLVAATGIKVDKTHHHHTIFHYEGVLVENHYDFLNIYTHRGNRQIEEKLKKESQMCRKSDAIANVYFPSDEFNTLFLLRHMGAHFAADRMTIRQLLDWALIPQVELTEEYKMGDYHQIVNAVCNDYLGFHLPEGNADSNLVRRVFDDIVAPYSQDRETLLFRFRRWFANRWKNQLFYQENLFISFFIHLWSHLVRPQGHAEFVQDEFEDDRL